MEYKASLGTTATIITIVVSLFLASFVSFLLYRAISANQVVLFIIFTAITMAIATLYFLTYLYRPIYYTVDTKHLTIKRPIKDIQIPMNEIRNAFLVRKESMRWTDRVAGNGGLFGFYGHFRNNFGLMTWHATKLGNYIMIETLNNRIIITPDNIEMVKEIRRLIGKEASPDANVTDRHTC